MIVLLVVEVLLLHVMLALQQGAAVDLGRGGGGGGGRLAAALAALHAVEPVRQHVGDRLGRALAPRKVEAPVAHQELRRRLGDLRKHKSNTISQGAKPGRSLKMESSTTF